MISDIGEGKILNQSQEFRDSSSPRASYGAVDFRAPEVYDSEGWSPKAEVFSFGVIACKIMQCRRYECISATPAWVISQVEEQYPGLGQDEEMMAHIVPAGVRKALEPCLSYSPDDRPFMKDVVLQLDKFSEEFLNDDGEYCEDDVHIRWIYWNWSESKRNGRHPKPSQSSAIGTSAENELDDFRKYRNVRQLD
jgi:Protein tyrosine and serine/threonine kinase